MGIKNGQDFRTWNIIIVINTIWIIGRKREHAKPTKDEKGQNAKEGATPVRVKGA